MSTVSKWGKSLFVSLCQSFVWMSIERFVQKRQEKLYEDVFFVDTRKQKKGLVPTNNMSFAKGILSQFFPTLL